MLKKIKKLITQKMIKPFQRHKLLNSKEFYCFKRDDDRSRIILLNTPEHGNLGDQAIRLAEIDFLQKRLCKNTIYEFTHEELKLCWDKVIKQVKNEDIILIQGGGYLGTLYPWEQNMVLNILSQFSKNHIVAFPQTIYFDTSAKESNNDAEEKKFIKILKKCNDLTIFARDRESYHFLKQNVNCPSVNYLYVPDMVTSLYYPRNAVKRSCKVLLCFRKDGEKVLDSQAIASVFQWLNAQNIPYGYSDTIVDRKVKRKKCPNEVYRKLAEFAGARLIITDRLHGMLFSAITSTPCIAFDNISHKVSGGYEWLRSLGYIKCVTEKTVTVELLNEMYNLKECAYDHCVFEEYYKLILDYIVAG